MIYAINILLEPNIIGEKIAELKNKTQQTLNIGSEDFLAESKPEAKNLAFPIKKQLQALMLNWEIKTAPEDIDKLDNFLKQEKQVLRFLISKKPEIKVLPKRRTASQPKQTEQPAAIKAKQEIKTKIEDFDEKLDEILENI